MSLTNKVIAWDNLTRQFWNLGIATYDLENIEGDAKEYSNDNDAIHRSLDKKFKDGSAKLYSQHAFDTTFDLYNMRRGQKFPAFLHAEDLIDLIEESVDKPTKKELGNINRIKNILSNF